MRYVVAIDGAGEYDSDFNVVVIDADTPREAVERLISPEMGYGRNVDGVAYVARIANVSAFTVNDSTRRVASPRDEFPDPL